MNSTPAPTEAAEITGRICDCIRCFRFAVCLVLLGESLMRLNVLVGVNPSLAGVDASVMGSYLVWNVGLLVGSKGQPQGRRQAVEQPSSH